MNEDTDFENADVIDYTDFEDLYNTCNNELIAEKAL